jgi:hypothetical protein
MNVKILYKDPASGAIGIIMNPVHVRAWPGVFDDPAGLVLFYNDESCVHIEMEMDAAEGIVKRLFKSEDASESIDLTGFRSKFC